MRHVDLGDGLQLSAIWWGGPVELSTEPLRDSYLVTVPLSGDIEIRGSANTVVATEKRAVITDYEEGTWQRWSPEAGAIWVQLASAVVEVEAQHRDRAEQRALTLPPRKRIRFEPDLDLTQPKGRLWRETLMRIVGLLDERGCVANIPSHRLKALRQQLITGLLRPRTET